MTTTREIKTRIKSVKDTQKITRAMYLIASNKLRKAKSELDLTRPYFNLLRTEINRIFTFSEKTDSKYIYSSDGVGDFTAPFGYLIITADKGMAGAYNQNIIKETLKIITEHKEPKLFVVGEYGRRYFEMHNIPIESSFFYTDQNPTLHRAREISSNLMQAYDSGLISKLFVIYTDMKDAINFHVCTTELLPLHRAHFGDNENNGFESDSEFEFVPSVNEVLDNAVPSYVTGFVYSTLVDSFCSEQNARMSAMDSANRNAQ